MVEVEFAHQRVMRVVVTLRDVIGPSGRSFAFAFVVFVVSVIVAAVFATAIDALVVVGELTGVVAALVEVVFVLFASQHTPVLPYEVKGIVVIVAVAVVECVFVDDVRCVIVNVFDTGCRIKLVCSISYAACYVIIAVVIVCVIILFVNTTVILWSTFFLCEYKDELEFKLFKNSNKNEILSG